MLKTEYKFGDVHALVPQVEAGEEKVHFQSIFENDNGGISLLAFKKGQELAKHLAPADVMVYVLEGEIEFTMIDRRHVLKAGEFMLMGEGVPHCVKANADSKMMLVKVKSSK